MYHFRITTFLQNYLFSVVLFCTFGNTVLVHVRGTCFVSYSSCFCMIPCEPPCLLEDQAQMSSAFPTFWRISVRSLISII